MSSWTYTGKKLMSIYVCTMLENMLYLLTDVQTQMPHTLDPSHRDRAFHPLNIVQAGIPRGC